MQFSVYLFKDSSIKEILSHALLADTLNFDTIWIPDEIPAKGFRDPFMTLAVLGWHIRYASIGTCVTNPYTRHPALIASAFNTLYELTGGRVIIGLSVGGTLPLQPLKIPLWFKPLKSLKEAIEIIKRLTTGERLTYDGEVFKVQNLELEPKPTHKIPILVGARGPKMLKLTGKYADGVLGSVPIPKIPYMIKNLEEGAKSKNRNISDFIIADGIPFAISKYRDDALDLVKPAIAMMMTFLNDDLIIDAGVPRERLEKVRSLVGNNEMEKVKDLITEEDLNNFSISGTSKDVLSKIKELKDLGINHILVQPPFGDSIEYAIKTVATGIKPHFAH